LKLDVWIRKRNPGLAQMNQRKRYGKTPDRVYGGGPSALLGINSPPPYKDGICGRIRDASTPGKSCD
jgi:hypothetical protein